MSCMHTTAHSHGLSLTAQARQVRQWTNHAFAVGGHHQVVDTAAVPLPQLVGSSRRSRESVKTKSSEYFTPDEGCSSRVVHGGLRAHVEYRLGLGSVRPDLVATDVPHVHVAVVTAGDEALGVRQPRARRDGGRVLVDGVLQRAGAHLPQHHLSFGPTRILPQPASRRRRASVRVAAEVTSCVGSGCLRRVRLVRTACVVVLADHLHFHCNKNPFALPVFHLPKGAHAQPALSATGNWLWSSSETTVQ